MNIQSLTITEAREKLDKKEISSVELTKASFSQIEKYDSALNAFVTICKENALEQAQKADELIANKSSLPLLGIPIALKDIYLTKGIRTTAGSKVLEYYIPQYNGTVTQKYLDSGAIIVGKTNLDAWAHGSSGENSDFGPTKNPFNTEYVPGGSSSGSSVAVSTGMVLAASGTDTGGSIRLPASFTNTVGIKPTYGRVSRYGVIAMASSLDSIGHFTKTVEDSALVLSVTAGNDPKDATTPLQPVDDYFAKIKNGVEGLKIGVPKEYFIKGLDPEVKNLTEKALQKLEHEGAELIEVSLPHTEYAIAVYYIVQTAEVSSNLARYDGVRYGSVRENFGDEAKRRIMLGTYVLSAGYYDAYYKKAMQIRTLLKLDFDKAFENVDVIIAPTSPTPPWKLGEKTADPLQMYLSDIFTAHTNLTGHPGVAVPIGFINSLPVGMQIIGPHFSEDLLYRIGYTYQELNPMWKQVPRMVAHNT